MLEMPWEPESPDADAPEQHRAGLHYHVARSLEESLEAWRLVYNSYCRDGLIDPNPHEIHTVPQAIGRKTAIAMARFNGSVVGTLSAYGDGTSGLPLDSVYHTEIEALRRNGRRPMEVGLFADRRGEVSRSVQSLFELMRFAFYFALVLSADDVVVGVHPRHAPFYMRLFSFEQIGAIKTYPTVKDRPVVLLKFDVNSQPAMNPLPKGLAYLIQHPLTRSAFKPRYLFDDAAVGESALGQFLAEKHATHAA